MRDQRAEEGASDGAVQRQDDAAHYVSLDVVADREVLRDVVADYATVCCDDLASCDCSMARAARQLGWVNVVQLDCGCRATLLRRGRRLGPGDDETCDTHGDVEVADVLAW